MKLLTKTNRVYLTFLLLFSPVMIAIDYCIIRYFVYSEVNEILVHESERIKYHVAQETELPSSNYILETSPVPADFQIEQPLQDTLLFDAYANKSIPYRMYNFMVDVGGEPTKIRLRHVLLEVNELIFWLFISTALIFLLMVIGLFFVNQHISNWIWKPFYQNLAKLREYDITQKNPVQLETSNISEFEALKKVITALMQQIEKDFQHLKEFNENISHEMQTPLAIIRNKMVLLLESQDLSPKELQWVQSAYQEVNKLSKIGKSLTLISRIENQEFTRMEQVDIRATVENILSNMDEIIQFKRIETRVELQPATLECDPILANILFTNLIKNAVQHNQNGGYIKIFLDSKRFEIENTGEVLQQDPDQLFNRFQKGNTRSETLGLGLAINQRICEIYGFDLNYYHQEGRHRFSLLFRSS